MHVISGLNLKRVKISPDGAAVSKNREDQTKTTLVSWSAMIWPKVNKIQNLQKTGFR